MDGDTHRASGGGEMPPFVFAHIPINWEEDFKGAGRTLDDGPNYRWQFVVEWPDEAAGENGSASSSSRFSRTDPRSTAS